MGFPRQEYWSGLPSPSAGDLPDPGIEPRSPPSQVDSLLSYEGNPTCEQSLKPLPQQHAFTTGPSIESVMQKSKPKTTPHGIFS